MVERIDGVNLRRQKRLQYSFDLLSLVLIKEQKCPSSQPKSGFLKRELGVQGTRQSLQFALPTASVAVSSFSKSMSFGKTPPHKNFQHRGTKKNKKKKHPTQTKT